MENASAQRVVPNRYWRARANVMEHLRCHRGAFSHQVAVVLVFSHGQGRELKKLGR
jgi:hypothetical protein